MKKVLTVCFSHKGNNYWNGEIRYLEKGNARKAAEMVQEAAGGDLFQIETVRPYSEDYRACVAEAKEEFQKQIRPELKEPLPDLDPYDILFVGYPNWCGTLPMAVTAFLEQYDLTGKRIYPFCSNEGSKMGRSEEDLKKICPGARIGRGLSVHGSETDASRPAITAWVKESLEEKA